MSGKNYGPSTGYLDPSGRNFETVIFQAGKPVLSQELNLEQDISALRPTASGWLSPDLLGAAAGNLSAIFTVGAAGNIIQFPNLEANVYGWKLTVANTNALGFNELTLPAPPIVAGTQRQDVIVLEVWRQLLSASPVATGKSPTGLIWRDGNVKIAAVDDIALNYPDDILDLNVGSESTKRVQVQYRLRVISGVDIFAFPYAMDDPTVVAYSVPTGPLFPDGVASVFAYVNQSPAQDGGLWRAGDGNPANALGTVDGYMYAIPLMGIFRRNSAAFNKNANHNGGVVDPGPSDRPDGLFSDVVMQDDIADLRSSSGPWAYEEVLDKNLTYLFDNALRSEWETTLIGGGVSGHTVLTAAEIGVLPGDGLTTGDTPGADFIGEFDAARRIFSDKPVMETITVALTPADCVPPAANWAPGQIIQIDPTALSIYPYAAFNWAARNSGLELWLDITRAHWVGAAAATLTEDALPYMAVIQNLGAMPVVAVTMTLGAGAIPVGLTNETLYVDIVVAYPPGLGVPKTPVDDYGVKSFMVNNPAQLPNVAPVWCDPAQLVLDVPSGITYLVNAPLTSFDYTHRELRLTYETSALTIVQAADTSGAALANQQIPLPERALTVTAVAKGPFGGPYVPVANPFTLSLDGRLVTVNIADASVPGDFWQVTYTAVRPLPQNGEQLTVFYQARAPQAAREALIGITQTLVPRYIPKQLYSLTSGSGSPGEGYPFPQAYVQTGGIFPSLLDTFTGEHELQGGANISTATFDATSGMLNLPTYINYVPNPEEVTFLRAPGDIDVENRTFFKSVPAGYLPNCFAQDLSDVKRHKCIVPFLAELPVDSALGTAGQLVMVLLTRWAKIDETNGVYFDADLNVNTTSASVFRLRNNLLNRSV